MRKGEIDCIVFRTHYKLKLTVVKRLLLRTSEASLPVTRVITGTQKWQEKAHQLFQLQRRTLHEKKLKLVQL
jgi:hypothetical protein